MKYIESLRDGDNVREVYFCKQKNAATTKTGKEYEILTLQDKTGMLDAKIWDPTSMGIGEFDAFDYVEVNGKVITYNGQLQLNVNGTRRVSESDVNIADYLPSSERSSDEMKNELKSYIASVSNKYYQALLLKIFSADFAAMFFNHSAAKTVHHGFVGGLAEHTLSVTKICDFYAKHYPMLSRDLLITASLCHDIGKVYELSDFPVNDYTDAGNLMGHIVMGSEMVGDAIRELRGGEYPDFPNELEYQLKHCILAHHGELEYGSPKKPAMAEAFALNCADTMDAKMETLKELFNSQTPLPGNEWMGFNRFLDSNIRRTTVKDEE